MAIMARGKQASMGVVVSFIVVALIMCIPRASVVVHATDVPDECAERLHAVTEQLHAVTAVKEAACAAVCYALQVEQSLDSVMMMHVAGCGCGDVLVEDGLSVSVHTGSRRTNQEDHSAATYRRALLQDDDDDADEVPDECVACEDLDYHCFRVDTPVDDEPVEEFDIDGYVTVGEDGYTPESLRGVKSISSDLFINAASDVDNLDFLSSLVEVGGRLIIFNSKLTSLDGLDKLEKVGDEFEIADNDYLADVDALSSLKEVGGSLMIVRNALLAYIEGLSELETVGGRVFIQDNTALLIFLEGLSALKEIGGELEISRNPSLFEFGRTDLPSLDSLTSVSAVLIEDNPSLGVFNGLHSLEIVDGMEISGNPSLGAFFGLGNLTTVGCDLRIHENASLRNLADLGSLTDIGCELKIYDNASLESLYANSGGSSALSSLEVVEDGCYIEPKELLTEGPENVRAACGVPEE